MADAPRPEQDLSVTDVVSAPRVDASAALDAVLAQARGTLRRAALAEALLATATASAVGALVAALVLSFAAFSVELRVGLLTMLGALVVGAAGVVAVVRGRPLAHDLVVAARLEDALRRQGVGVRDALRGAVELRDEARDASLGRSRALCDAHIDAQVRLVIERDAQGSLPSVALERALPTLYVAAIVAAVALVAVFARGDVIAARLTQLWSAEAARDALAARAAQEPPLVTDLTVTLRFPAYMARADEVIPGAVGDITAPGGTEVLLEGRVDASVRSLEGATLVVTGGPKELGLKADVEGRAVRARFTVAAPGAWRFVLNDGGDERADAIARKITVLKDAAPVVRLEAPSADRVVKADEEVKLLYAAEDDVGLKRVRVSVRRQGGSAPPFERVLEEVAGVRSVAGSGVLAIADVGARPGERLAVTIEALDTDDVSGPNIGRSATRVLTVFSAAQHHKEVIARLDALLAHVVEVLGDELEAPVPEVADAAAQRKSLDQHKALEPRAREMLVFFSETLAAVAEDSELGGEDEAGVRRALANMRVEVARAVDEKVAAVTRAPPVSDRAALPVGIWRRVLDAQRRLVERLESDALYLEDLLQRERLREAKQLVDDVKRAQGDLKELLKQYKESGDPATRQALLDEIRRMQEQLAQLAQRLGELRREVPDEFVNADAFKSDELFNNAASLDEMIEEGRLDEAAEALDAMLESTEKMLGDLDEAQDEVGGPEAKELREKLDRFTADLDALEASQREALEETEEIMDAARKRAEQRLGSKLQAALAEAKKKAQQAKDALDKVDPEGASMNRYEEEDTETARARTEDLLKALESGDVEDALRAAEEAEAAASAAEQSVDDRQRRRQPFTPPGQKKATSELREASRALREAREKLDNAAVDPSDMLDASDKARLQKLAEGEAQRAEQAQKLSEQMSEIGEKAPVFGPQHGEQLREAQDAMKRAERKLQGQSQRGRPERGGLRQARQAQSQALQGLSGLKKSLQEQGKGSGSGGRGMPMPYPSGGAPGAEGGDGEGRSNREDVKIPDGSEFKVKDAFRKDILDAMRESAPGEWAGEVKRYYEELIK